MNAPVFIAAAAAVASFFLLLGMVRRSDASAVAFRQEVTNAVSALTSTLGSSDTWIERDTREPEARA